jgi:hypothetical protein
MLNNNKRDVTQSAQLSVASEQQPNATRLTAPPQIAFSKHAGTGRIYTLGIRY